MSACTIPRSAGRAERFYWTLRIVAEALIGSFYFSLSLVQFDLGLSTRLSS